MSRPSSLLAIASGKGGVGKTWLSITLAHAVAKSGRKAIILDGDIGLANIDIQIGLAPTRDLSLWASEGIGLGQLTMPTAHGFDIIPGASGSSIMAGAKPAEIARMAGEFSTLASDYDVGIIDISAGIDATQLRLAGATGRCLLVVTEDPTSLTDGYAFIKLAHKSGRAPEFEIVVNMAETAQSGEKIYAALARACKSFLGIEPPLAGIIRRDPAVAQAIRRQTPLLAHAPGAPAALDVQALATSLTRPRAKAA